MLRSAKKWLTSVLVAAASATAVMIPQDAEAKSVAEYIAMENRADYISMYMMDLIRSLNSDRDGKGQLKSPDILASNRKYANFIQVLFADKSPAFEEFALTVNQANQTNPHIPVEGVLISFIKHKYAESQRIASNTLTMN